MTARALRWPAPYVFLVAGGMAVLLPYLLVPVIPGSDYANHLARLAVLGAPAGSAIRGSFAPHWALMPDLGLDLAYMALKPVASADTVLRLCLVGALACMMISAAGIQRILFKTPSLALALVPMCGAGLPVVMGYVNFVMGCVIALIGMWACLAWREKLSAARMTTLATIGAVAWLCHIAGYAILMVFVGCTLVWPDVRARRLLGLVRSAGATGVIAMPGLIMSALAEHETVSTHLQYGLYALRGLIAPVQTTGQPSDYLIWAGVVAIAASILRYGTWQVAEPARSGTLALVAIVALMPWRIGSAFDVGARLATPAMIVLLATSRITPPIIPSSRVLGARLMMAAIALLIAERDLALVTLARSEAQSVKAFRAAVQKMPAGATVMSVRDVWQQADCTRASVPLSAVSPNSHLAAYATIDKGAWNPFIFAAQGMQPIRSVVPFARGELPASGPPDMERIVPHAGSHTGYTAATTENDLVPASWPAHFDYLLVVGRGCHANPIPALLKPQAEGPGFTLFSVLKPARP